MKLRFRTSQLLGYTLVIALMGVFTIYTGLSFITKRMIAEAQLTVQMDLNSAWDSYREEQARLQNSVLMASRYEALWLEWRDSQNPEGVPDKLTSLEERYGLDFLLLIDREGSLIGNGAINESLLKSPVLQDAFNGQITSGTVLLSPADLLPWGETLAEQAYTPLIATELARSTVKDSEDRGMFLLAAIPLFDQTDQIEEILLGGILLNKRYPFVDRIRDTVFGQEFYKGKPLGTVTIFLWDVRINTNVIQADSSRAIGTRVSDEVSHRVLWEGERFGDRAFVVNDWYLSAYDPILDPAGDIIGIFYVGMLEQKYLDYQSRLTLEYIGIIIISFLLAVALALFYSYRLRRPIQQMVVATRDLAAGNLDTRVNSRTSIQELGELASGFNTMAQSLETHNRKLEQTTRQLKQEHLLVEEKNRAYMEMLGFVTHELKSPLASIVFAIGSLRDKILGPLNESQQSQLKAAANSADYLNSTIANLLNLSRIEEGQLQLKPSLVDLRERIVEPALQRIAEIAADRNLTFRCGIPGGQELTCDPDLMAAVFQNLFSNAVKYSRQDSVVTIEMLRVGAWLQFSIHNEGMGFQPEDSERLFQKFFRTGSEGYNTKSGTGLGLFVTRNIVELHGGKITAESEPGNWALFTFSLPSNPTQQPSVVEKG
jgi:two-component system, NtrC family, sensor kinase